MRSTMDGQQSLTASELSYSTVSVESDTVAIEAELNTPPAEISRIPDGIYTTSNGRYKVDYFKANPPELRKSYTLITDLWHNKTNKYEDTGAIGKGVYGAAHKHTADNKKSIVSKKSHKPDDYQSKKEIEKLLDMSEREVFFARELYPDEHPHARFSWLMLNPNQTDKKYGKLETRNLRAMIEDSITLFEFTESCENIDDLALIIFYVMVEVERMHTKTYSTGNVGMVHGDLSGNNIMVSLYYDVKLIDFAFTSFVGDETFIFKMTDYKTSYMPKERTYKEHKEEATRTAEISQDIYTLAHNLKKAFEKQLKMSMRLALYNKYPDILTFISNSLVDVAHERPKLREFIDRLKHQLHNPMLRKAVRTLHDVDLIDYISQTSMHYQATDYNQVIFSFIEEENFTTAAKLLNLLQHHDEQFAKNNVAKLLRMIFEIKSEFDEVDNGKDANDQRQDLTSELLTALDFARVVCKNASCSPSSDLICAIRKHKRLDVLYRNLYETQADLLRGHSFTPLHQNAYRK